MRDQKINGISLVIENTNRSERIRTSGPCLPKTVHLLVIFKILRFSVLSYSRLHPIKYHVWTGLHLRRRRAPIRLISVNEVKHCVIAGFDTLGDDHKMCFVLEKECDHEVIFFTELTLCAATPPSAA